MIYLFNTNKYCDLIGTKTRRKAFKNIFSGYTKQTKILDLVYVTDYDYYSIFCKIVKLINLRIDCIRELVDI